MKPTSRLAKLTVGLVLASLLLAAPVLGQQQQQDIRPQQPVMQNVFFNVVWGSAFGATMGVAIAVIGSQDKSSPSNVRGASFNGATAGGLIGLGIGLYLVYTGITFNPAASQFSTARAAPASGAPLAALAAKAPFALETSKSGALRITGFKATVLDLKF